jgi:hypothetical protein
MIKATIQQLHQAVEATLPTLKVQPAKQIHFIPLAEVTNPTVPTDAAAYYLNRKSQTLRAWACFENAPIRPIRINGRLAWKTADIRALLNGGV